MPSDKREPKRKRMPSTPTRSPTGKDGDRTHESNSTHTDGLRVASMADRHDGARRDYSGGDEGGLPLSDSQKLDFIIKKLNDMEDRLEGKIYDMEKRIDDLPTKKDFKSLEDKIDEHENRMKRNNIILHNVPEKAEGDDCAGFVKGFIMNHMGLKADSIEMDKWEIERAHRSPTGPPQQNRTTPRLIFVKFLRYQDRVLVLKAAPRKLKDNPFTPTGSKTTSRIYISDDVSEPVRKQRKKLVVLKKKIKEMWPDRKVFIPPTVPAILLRENGSGKLVRMLPDDKLESD